MNDLLTTHPVGLCVYGMLSKCMNPHVRRVSRDVMRVTCATPPRSFQRKKNEFHVNTSSSPR